jgi:EAL domain-containing protein (putative c-di-GMP-specific phosphodiesterase class I)
MEVAARPVTIDDKEMQVGASIGITLCPDDADDAESLLKNADLAMYQAKAEGGRRFAFYSNDMQTRAFAVGRLDAELRRAIEQKQFVLHYQPQVDARSGHIIGAEALVRWNRDGVSLVYPGEFLGRAEENGLIVAINEWVLKEACSEAQRWARVGLPPLRIAVNMSPVQFRGNDVADLVSATLRETGLDPRRLDLEITESVMVENSEALVDDLNRLHGLGVSFSIDDFGTGYSSFRYIKSFPIDRLKIDQSFIRTMASNTSDAAIVEAIIGLAKNLKLAVLAEGVETVEQRDWLVGAGCDEVQGYLFSRPIPADDFIALVRADSTIARSA